MSAADFPGAMWPSSNAARQLRALAEAALELAAAATLGEQTVIVIDRHVRALSADGGGFSA